MAYTFFTAGKLIASSFVITLAFSSTAMVQAKSSTQTQADVNASQPNATSYGSTRSNKLQAGIIAPSGETRDVDVPRQTVFSLKSIALGLLLQRQQAT